MKLLRIKSTLKVGIIPVRTYAQIEFISVRFTKRMYVGIRPPEKNMVNTKKPVQKVRWGSVFFDSGYAVITQKIKFADTPRITRSTELTAPVLIYL
ncbi:hypothetical protein FACS1894142_0820 [Spirochaetia bacterium]|nr:hypothetical protein FACS1894142_0820 [Spirochaetia bacterium]